jgi:hypothetical protein
MHSFTFSSLVEESASIWDLARRLGAICMDHGAELQVALEDRLLAEVAESLTDHVTISDPAAWTAIVGDPGQLKAQLEPGLAALLEQADLYYPLDCLGVLRGLCRGVLPSLYATAYGTVPLDRGTPVPFAPRPLLDGFEKTPLPERLNSNDLLGGYGHRLFEFSAGEAVQVVLDFAARSRIDELTWSGEERLPRVATIHPQDCGALEVRTRTESEFFDAGPAEWRPEEVLSLLRQVADVEIAVLPELSLPSPAALEREMSQNPAEFPGLVIAGSAHVRVQDGSRAVRANETRIYLDGKDVGSHRKCHPYIASKLEGKKLPQPLGEAITAEQKKITVLSGEYSRLAVVICADLNDQYIPQKLIAAGVNTLLVPSFTPKKGSFSGPIADLAARCQGVSVIANAPPDEAAAPFHGMVAVPRPNPAEQSAAYPHPEGPQPTRIAVFDPNEPIQSAIQWR